MRVCDCFETAVHVGFKHRWMMLPQSYPIACLWCFCKCVFFGFCALLPSCGLFPSSSYLVSPSRLRLVCWLSFPPSSPMPSLRLFSSRLLAVILVTKFLHSSLRLVCWLSFPQSSSYARLVCWLSFPPSSFFVCLLVSSLLLAVSRRQVRLGCRSLLRLVCALGPLLQCVSAHQAHALNCESSSRRCCLCAYPCVTESRRHVIVKPPRRVVLRRRPSSRLCCATIPLRCLDTLHQAPLPFDSGLG